MFLINNDTNIFSNKDILVTNKLIYLLNSTKYSMSDILSDILSKVKLTSVVYFKSDFSEPWGMEIPKGPFAQFHIVTKGQCVLKN